MGVPSQCTIVRAIGRSTRAHKVFSRRNRTQNHTISSQRKKQLYSVSVKPYKQTRKFHAGVRKAQSISVKLSVKLPNPAVGSFVRPSVGSVARPFLVAFLIDTSFQTGYIHQGTREVGRRMEKGENGKGEDERQIDGASKFKKT